MPPVPVERKLAALLSADAVGYSRLMAEDEQGTIRTLTSYRTEIANLVTEHRGRVADAPGDNLLAEFPSALDAVECAAEIQRVLQARNRGLPEGRRMPFRIGIHLGDVSVQDGRLYGDGVNIAARLEPLAEPGGICISAAVHDQVGSKLDLGYQDLGEQRVKNIPGPVRVYRVQIDPPVASAAPLATTATRGVGRRALVVAAGLWVVVTVAVGSWLYFPNPSPVVLPGVIRSIVVLPLENLSGDPEQEYFADGMTEALIGDLAKIRSLRVISRTSAMHYKGAHKPLPEIARELDVDAVVEGTVTRAGDRVRITAQLIYAATDEHLWSERYERDLQDVLSLQSEVARDVARQIQIALSPDEQARLTRVRRVDPRAHIAYLKGRHHWNQRSSDGLTRAVEYFQQAIDLDPTYALAWAGLADAHLLLPLYGDADARASRLKSKTAAERALELDEALAAAHASLGFMKMSYEWDWAGGDHELKRAIELEPSYAPAHYWYAVGLDARGHADESLAQAELAERLDPLSLIAKTIVGRRHYFAGRYEAAIGKFHEALELSPDNVLALFDAALAYAQASRFEEGLQMARRLRARDPDNPDGLAALAYNHGRSGRHERARELAAELERRPEARKAQLLALVYASIGDTDQVLDWLERAEVAQSRGIWMAGFDPAFEDFRAHPRFTALLRRMGLPAPELATGPATSVVVLPFADMSPAGDQEYFADGMAEELIHALSKIPELRVMARTSAFAFKGSNADVREIGARLKVGTVVEGSVRKAGDRLRITAQAVRAEDGVHLWSEVYDRQLTDVFAVQEEIALAVAEAVKVKILPRSAGVAAPALAAYEVYLKGRHQWNRRTREANRRAIGYFEEAIRLDPDYSLAHVGLADALYLEDRNYQSAPPEELMPRARAAATRALEIDPKLGEAHIVLGVVLASYERDWDRALAALERGLDLTPQYAMGHAWYGIQLVRLRGRFGEGRGALERARDLDPLSPTIATLLAASYYYERRYEEALEKLDAVFELAPDFNMGHASQSRTLLALDRPREAVRAAERASWSPGLLGWVYGRAGRETDAQRVLAELVEASSQRYVAPLEFADVHLGLGELDEALDWLERAERERSGRLPIIGVAPRYDPLREHPQFESLMQRLALPVHKLTPEDEG